MNKSMNMETFQVEDEVSADEAFRWWVPTNRTSNKEVRSLLESLNSYTALSLKNNDYKKAMGKFSMLFCGVGHEQYYGATSSPSPLTLT